MTCQWMRALSLGTVQGSPYLVDIELDEQSGHALAILGVVLANTVDGLRDKLQHQIEEDLVLLCCGVEAMLELNHVAVVHHFHDLQLSVLEPLVLKHLLDSDLPAWQKVVTMCCDAATLILAGYVKKIPFVTKLNERLIMTVGEDMSNTKFIMNSNLRKALRRVTSFVCSWYTDGNT